LKGSLVAASFHLIAPKTRVTANGDGASADVSGSATRTFLCTLEISDQIEQEALDVSIWGSPDGQNFGTQPLLKIPQSFYNGSVKQVLELSYAPQVKFIRAHWDLTRWGRVAPHPMFVISLRLDEVPAFPRSAFTADSLSK
jgi:hypothetical protein